MSAISRLNRQLVMIAAVTCLALCGCATDEGDGGTSAASESAVSTATVPVSDSPMVSPAGSPSGASEDPTLAKSAEAQRASELRIAADEILALLAAGDYKALAERVHPSQGVRFTPYLTVDLEGDVQMTPDQVSRLGSDNKSYTWGADPGTGEPIKGTFAEYSKRFITNLDYASAPMISENQRVSSGSSLDNVADAYPNSQFVEYHFPGFEAQYEGLDWQSQRLVFVEKDGQLYLVGIIHDSWTP